jgi:hypothetical protein
MAYHLPGPQRIRPHQGDGQFNDTSWQASTLGIPLYNIPSYTVYFPEFDLHDNYDGVYHVTGLSNIGKTCRFYLAIADPGRRLRQAGDEPTGIEGSLHIEICTTEGNVVATSSGDLSDYVWGYWLDAHRLHQMSALEFSPNASARYTIRISYKTDGSIKGLMGRGYLECGVPK